MGRPVDVDDIVNRADSHEVAAEIYLASLLAIDVMRPAPPSSPHLTMLAACLQLPPKLVTELNHQVESENDPGYHNFFRG